MPRSPIYWVISDTHFYHPNIINYENRPVGFEEKIIKNLQRLLVPQDTLIHLGDVIFYRYTELKSILDSFPGRKILTLGNHDKRNPGWYMRNGFDFAADVIQMGKVIFSHKPLEFFPDNAEINVHGHLHSTGHRPTESWWDPGGKHRLFILEHHYRPIPLDKFLSDTEGCSFEILQNNGS